ncbi:DUF7660 family protein [Paenibacillus daejeonensis]|uniref:DUF7660 family protein n=1 Tax=Paenibacillus daejeonensis TaxID=135193 RepID=UPI0003A93EB7|nr:hypothetical protein [Paenibacillus daejeonensis]
MKVMLFQLLQEVNDEKSFLKFVEALGRDYVDHPNEWANGTIASFADAAASWGEESIESLVAYVKPSNPWKRCADILYMGKIYE